MTKPPEAPPEADGWTPRIRNQEDIERKPDTVSFNLDIALLHQVKKPDL